MNATTTTVCKLTVKKFWNDRYYVFEAGTHHFWLRSFKYLDNAIRWAQKLESLGYGTYIGTDEVQEKNTI